MTETTATEPLDRLARLEDLVERTLYAITCLASDWGAAQQAKAEAPAPKPAKPALVVSNLRRVDKGRLLAILDLYIVPWHLHMRGVRWLRWEDGAEVIALPEREYTDNAGSKRYQKINEFGDSATFQRFNKAAIEAIHVFVEQAKATEQ